jgi:hypothetical protein
MGQIVGMQQYCPDHPHIPDADDELYQVRVRWFWVMTEIPRDPGRSKVCRD